MNAAPRGCAAAAGDRPRRAAGARMIRLPSLQQCRPQASAPTPARASECADAIAIAPAIRQSTVVDRLVAHARGKTQRRGARTIQGGDCGPRRRPWSTCEAAGPAAHADAFPARLTNSAPRRHSPDASSTCRPRSPIGFRFARRRTRPRRGNSGQQARASGGQPPRFLLEHLGRGSADRRASTRRPSTAWTRSTPLGPGAQLSRMVWDLDSASVRRPRTAGCASCPSRTTAPAWFPEPVRRVHRRAAPRAAASDARRRRPRRRRRRRSPPASAGARTNSNTAPGARARTRSCASSGAPTATRSSTRDADQTRRTDFRRALDQQDEPWLLRGQDPGTPGRAAGPSTSATTPRRARTASPRIAVNGSPATSTAGYMHLPAPRSQCWSASGAATATAATLDGWAIATASGAMH